MKTNWKQKSLLFYSIIHDVFWRFKTPLSQALLAEILGVIAQTAAYTLVFTYVNALEKGETLRLEYINFILDQSQLTGWFSGAVLVLFTCSAVLLYWSQKIILNTAQHYERFCLTRLITLSSHLPHPGSPIANKILFKDNQQKTLQQSTRFSGRILLRYASLATPLSWLLISSIVLLSMEWHLFLLLLLLLPGVGGVMWFISKKAVFAARQAERLKLPAKKEQQQLWGHLWQSATHINKNDPTLVKILTKGNYHHYQQALYNRLKSTESAGLVINLLIAISITLTLILVDLISASSSWSWSALALYLLALRYFLANLSTISRVLVGSLRHYPALSLYWQFIQDTKQITSRQTKCHKFILKLHSLQENITELPLPTGSYALLIHPGLLDRNIIAEFLEKQKFSSPPPNSNYWFASEYSRPQKSLRQYLMIPKGLDMALFSKQCTVLPTKIAQQLQHIDLDNTINEQYWKSIGSEMQSILKILAAFWSQSPIVLLDYKITRSAQEILALLKDRLLLIHYPPDITILENIDNSVVILSNGKQLTGWCHLDWLQTHADILKENIGVEKKRATGFDFDDDDD